MLSYHLIRTKRKTIALIVNREGCLIVRAPERIPITAVEAFIREKECWILKKQQEAAPGHRAPLEVAEGEMLYFGGRQLELVFYEGAEPAVKEAQMVLPVGTDREVLRQWLKKRAQEELTAIFHRRREEMGLSCQGPKLSDAQGRWGSCSGKNVVRLSWRLIMAPPETADYVVVHELCHVLHKNHSKDFWVEVERYCPCWREHRKWLRDHGEIMTCI